MRPAPTSSLEAPESGMPERRPLAVAVSYYKGDRLIDARVAVHPGSYGYEDEYRAAAYAHAHHGIPMPYADEALIAQFPPPPPHFDTP